MRAVGHPRQRCHRLALGAGAHEHDLVVGVLVEVLHVDDDPARGVQEPEVLGDLHIAHHRPADEHDLAAVRLGGFEDLLDAVDVGGEGGDDDPVGRRGDDGVEDRADLLLRGGEAGNLGVGRVSEEQVDTLFAEACEGAQVGDPAVERQLVHLEVAGVQHGARTGADEHGQGVGDRVVDGDEFQVEGPELVGFVLAHHAGDGLAQAVLLELRLHQRQGQRRAEDGDVLAALEQVGHRADVVFVTVGEDQADDVVHPVVEVAEVRQDEVDAGLLLFGEEDTAVDDEQLAAVLEDGHVPADLAEAAEGDDAHRLGVCLRWVAGIDRVVRHLVGHVR